MELNKLYDIASKENIDIINWKMNCKARIIHDEDYTIYIDYSKFNTTTDEKCTLAEELGHYYFEGYYTLASSQTDIHRAEYKALKWRSMALVKYSDIQRCFNKGLHYISDIAEELQVSNDMVEFALNYYKENATL